MYVLTKIKEHLILSILIGSILGLFLGRFVDVSWFSKLILPLTILMVFPMMVGLNYHALKEPSSKKLQFSVQLTNFILYPLLGFGVGYLFFPDEIYMRLGLLMITLLPTSGMTISWTMMAKGNAHEAIRMVVIGLLIGAFLTPFYIDLFLGATVNVSLLSVLKTIGTIIFIPLVIGFVTQRYLIQRVGEKKFQSMIKPKLPLVSTSAVVIMIFVVMSLKAKLLWSNPLLFIKMIGPIVLLYMLMYLIALWIGKKMFSRNEAIAFTNGTLVRNLSISLAIVLSAFPDAGVAAVLLAIAYVVQVQFAAWNTKLSDKIYGSIKI